MLEIDVKKMFLLAMFPILLAFPGSVLSATPKADRIAVESRVKKEIEVDFAQPYALSLRLAERKCLDGRPVKDFQGEVIEYWANLECPYCGIAEPLKVQRDNGDICIIVRHAPVSQYGEAMKKALAFEALRSFSVNSANRFWDAVVPKTSLAIPVPYEAALRAALDEALITPEAFAEVIEKVSSAISNDILAGQNRISTTPTYIIQGIRFPACDFRADQLPQAIDLARKARSGDLEAKKEIMSMITRGILNEQIL